MQDFLGWACTSRDMGSFWDGGQWAQTDWDNQWLSYSVCYIWGCYAIQNPEAKIRIWTQPNGNYWSAAYAT